MRHSIAFLLVGVALSTSAFAQNWIGAHIPNAQKQGEGRLRYLFWDVYDASLWASNGKWDAQQPYALTLSYLMEIDGADIADRSAEEIRALGFNDEVKLAAWQKQMRAIFPNVAAGTSLTGIYKPNEGTHFYAGEQEVGIIQDVEFGAWFFNIWLSEKTSEPALRAQLLGI